MLPFLLALRPSPSSSLIPHRIRVHALPERWQQWIKSERALLKDEEGGRYRHLLFDASAIGGQWHLRDMKGEIQDTLLLRFHWVDLKGAGTTRNDAMHVLYLLDPIPRKYWPYVAPYIEANALAGNLQYIVKAGPDTLKVEDRSDLRRFCSEL
jgi:hypothetical protein